MKTEPRQPAFEEQINLRRLIQDALDGFDAARVQRSKKTAAAHLANLYDNLHTVARTSPIFQEQWRALGGDHFSRLLDEDPWDLDWSHLRAAKLTLQGLLDQAGMGLAVTSTEEEDVQLEALVERLRAGAEGRPLEGPAVADVDDVCPDCGGQLQPSLIEDDAWACTNCPWASYDNALEPDQERLIEDLVAAGELDHELDQLQGGVDVEAAAASAMEKLATAHDARLYRVELAEGPHTVVPAREAPHG